MTDEVLSFMMPMNMAVVVLFVGLIGVGYILWKHYTED